jgi:hypothetical protein
MNNKITVITNASWEDRFELGIKKIIDQKKPTEIISFYLESFSELTKNSRASIKKYCESHQIEYFEISLENSSIYWKKIQAFFSSRSYDPKRIYLDITTMPREIIWILLAFLTDIFSNIYYIYNEPQGYDEDWLCRNHSKPRLVFKLSGIYDLRKPTALITISGFDFERTKHIIRFFEPHRVRIGLQAGKQFLNMQRNYNLHKDKFSKHSDKELFDLNAYDKDHGFDEIEKQIIDLKDTSNIIISSLGPKLTAISIFKLHKKYPQIALAYIPSKEYNVNYSYGIKECHLGVINTVK